MSVDIHPTDHQHTGHGGHGAPRAVRPDRRGSLAAGLVIALALTLVVFAGADRGRHHRVDARRLRARLGADRRPVRPVHRPPPALDRRTGRRDVRHRSRAPRRHTGQRSPDRDGLDVAAVPMLALAAYVWFHSRRDLPGRGRRLLAPVVAVLALASVGATYENVTVLRDQHSYATGPGASYDVGGHRLTSTAAARAAPRSCSTTVSARSPPRGRASSPGSEPPPASAPTTEPGRAGARTPRAAQDGIDGRAGPAHPATRCR